MKSTIITVGVVIAASAVAIPGFWLSNGRVRPSTSVESNFAHEREPAGDVARAYAVGLLKQLDAKLLNDPRVYWTNVFAAFNALPPGVERESFFSFVSERLVELPAELVLSQLKAMPPGASRTLIVKAVVEKLGSQ